MSRFSRLRQEVQIRRRTMSRHRHPITIALDAMGSDTGPEEMVRGAFEAIQALPEVTVICVGDRTALLHIIRANRFEHPRLLIEHSTQIIGMDEKPHDSLRKSDSSVAVAARLCHEK